MSKPLRSAPLGNQRVSVPELKVSSARKQSAVETTPFAHWRTEDGRIAVAFYRVAGGYMVRFLGRADFTVLASAQSVRAWPHPGTSNREVRDLYLNQVLPMICGQRGDLVIHASAVAAPMGALGFVAPTGRGKSTLAAAFARSGIPFLTDDGLTLTRNGTEYAASPNRPSFRLWQDSQGALEMNPAEGGALGEKRLVEACPSLPFHAAAVPLRALYFIGSGKAVATDIDALGPTRAMAELINHSFLLDVTEPERLSQHFHDVGELAETVPCYTLDYPRDYAALPQVIAAVLKHAGLKVEDR